MVPVRDPESHSIDWYHQKYNGHNWHHLWTLRLTSHYSCIPNASVAPSLNKKNRIIADAVLKSGRQDSNLRSPGPKPGAVTGLGHAPCSKAGGKDSQFYSLCNASFQSCSTPLKKRADSTLKKRGLKALGPQIRFEA